MLSTLSDPEQEVPLYLSGEAVKTIRQLLARELTLALACERTMLSASVFFLANAKDKALLYEFRRSRNVLVRMTDGLQRTFHILGEVVSEQPCETLALHFRHDQEALEHIPEGVGREMHLILSMQKALQYNIAQIDGAMLLGGQLGLKGILSTFAPVLNEKRTLQTNLVQICRNIVSRSAS